jgi:branched-chain amino acid transport system ATP-binding protein
MAILHVEKICKHFGGLVAVNDFSMVVEEKEIVGLIGPNGAGKTTLFNMIACFYPPTSGCITFEGKNLTGKKPYHVCNMGIARTFQVTKPFINNTVLENVMVAAFARTANPREARRKSLESLEKVEFLDKKDMIGAELTTADHKRLELARALATEPKLILLDEVMAGLNANEKIHVVDILRNIRNQGVTFIFVEHDLKVVMNFCERIVLLNRGEKLIEGPPSVVANDPQAIAAYMGNEYAST